MTLKGIGDSKHFGRITDYDPPALLAYELTDGHHEQPLQVRVDFYVEGNGTRVRLTQNGLDDRYSPFVREGWANGFEGLARFLAGELVERV